MGLGGVDGTSTKQQGEDGDNYGMSLDDLLAMENSSLMDVMNLGDGVDDALPLDGPAPDTELHLAMGPTPEPTPEPALLPDPDVVQCRPTASQDDAPSIIELQLDPAPEPDPEPDATANQDREPEEADEVVELLSSMTMRRETMTSSLATTSRQSPATRIRTLTLTSLTTNLACSRVNPL